MMSNIEKFYKLRPLQYKFLKSLYLTRNVSKEGCSAYEVELIFVTIDQNISPNSLRLRCANVVDIKIGKVEGMYGIQLEVVDIKDRQLEGVSYRIYEAENEAFSFLCADFQVDLINERES